ncbi:hypothetical protein AA11237_1580 [Acidocella aminolytica 101 = DSM 11237]|nr:hypothetical protein AA11237_1580 [Acidocella aminolytica 101 = DSM 11237]
MRMREAVRITGRLKRVTISREADRWFASVTVETDDVRPVAQPLAAIGVDLGITTLATLSNGASIPGPKAHKALLKRLRRANKAMPARCLPPAGPSVNSARTSPKPDAGSPGCMPGSPISAETARIRRQQYWQRLTGASASRI